MEIQRVGPDPAQLTGLKADLLKVAPAPARLNDYAAAQGGTLTQTEMMDIHRFPGRLDRHHLLGACMDEAEVDVLAYMAFPSQHRTKLHCTNPLDRLNKEVKRRADVVGVFPNEEAITRLLGAVLLASARQPDPPAGLEAAGPSAQRDGR